MWQLIETAPKDESWVMLVGPLHGEPHGCIAFWSEDDSLPGGGGWFESEAAGNPVADEYWRPTHWMPYTPPKELEHLE